MTDRHSICPKPLTCGGGTSLPRQRLAGPMSRVTSLYHAEQIEQGS